jgi:hypothetical protein
MTMPLLPITTVDRQEIAVPAIPAGAGQQRIVATMIVVLFPAPPPPTTTVLGPLTSEKTGLMQ